MNPISNLSPLIIIIINYYFTRHLISLRFLKLSCVLINKKKLIQLFYNFAR